MRERIDAQGWAELNQHPALCLTSPAACCHPGGNRWAVLGPLVPTRREGSESGVAAPRTFHSLLVMHRHACSHSLPSGLVWVKSRNPKLFLLEPPGEGTGLHTEPLPRCGKRTLATASCHSATWDPLPTLWAPSKPRDPSLDPISNANSVLPVLPAA